MSTNMATDSALDAFTERGRTIVSRHTISLGDKCSLGAALKSITGGKVSMNLVDLIVAEGPHGREVLAQPYAGNTPLPGELHATAAGALVAPAAYDDAGFFGFNWNSADERLQRYLRSQKFAAYELPEQLKHGFTAIKLGWTVQVNAIAADQSWITCQLGGFSGAGAHAAALGVVDELRGAVAQSRAVGPQPTAHPLRLARFAELAFANQLDAALAGDKPGDSGTETYETLDPQAARSAIEAALGHQVGKRVLVGAITDERRLKNITTKVAIDVDPAEICAFVDTGLRASGKAGVAFTPTAVYINELGDRFRFDYSTISSFRIDGSELTITSTDGNTVKIASHGEAAIIMEGLVAATGRAG